MLTHFTFIGSFGADFFLNVDLVLKRQAKMMFYVLHQNNRGTVFDLNKAEQFLELHKFLVKYTNR